MLATTDPATEFSAREFAQAACRSRKRPTRLYLRRVARIILARQIGPEYVGTVRVAKN